MYWRPMTVMFSALPFGGSLRSALAYSRPLSPTSSAPLGPRVRRVLDRGELDEREHGEPEQDHRGADRPADLQARVAADLRGHRALARAELDQRVAERALDRDEDDQRDDSVTL